MQFRIFSQIDLAHPAFTEKGKDPVMGYVFDLV